MDRVKIKQMLLSDVQDALKSALTIHNIEIKIKNLLEAVNIASTLLYEVEKEERIHDILFYVDISFNVLISPQKLYVMTYLYELYDDSFVFEVENNEENISESHMKFFVHLYDFRFFEKTGEMNESEFKGKVKLVEHIFTKNNVNWKRVSSSIPPIDGFEFVYPLDTEVFWFLI
jgi:hypothetical protein